MRGCAGFGLAHVKLQSTWAQHCPAYYVALNLENKEVLIAVRGTAQFEDVVTDLTALPKVLLHDSHEHPPSVEHLHPLVHSMPLL